MEGSINLYLVLGVMMCIGVQSRPQHHQDYENWVSQKEYVCAAKPADVIFALDTSNSIWRPDFIRQLEFVKQVVDFFIIGKDNIRVGALSFSDRALNQFQLKSYEEKSDLQDAILNIEQYGGVFTYTNQAINYVAKRGFTADAGARDGVTKVLIVITDGRSYNGALTAEEAKLARAKGIHIFAIGVGYRVDEDELRSIASEPTDEYMFMVDNFSMLDRIKKLLAIKTCTVTDPPTTTTTTSTTPAPTTTTTTTTTQQPTIKFESRPVTPKLVEITTTPQKLSLEKKTPDSDGRMHGNVRRKGCIPKQPLDLAFIVDEKQGGSEYKRKLWKFVRNVVSKLNFEDGDIRISFIRECADIPELHLNKFSNKTRLLDHFDSIRPKSGRTAGLLRAMTNKLTSTEDEDFSDNNVISSTQDRKKIGVYITDGESQDLQATLRESQNAKLSNDIEIFGVGVTDEVNPVELNALVSCEVENHLLTVPTHSALNNIYKKLAHKICKAPL